MTKENFLNSGKKEADVILENTQQNSQLNSFDIPIGIRLPLSKGKKSKESLFEMNFEIEKQISNNFKVFLSTKKGELLCNPEFGLPIFTLYNKTNLSLEDIENIVMKEIKEGTSKYFPSIELEDFESVLDPLKNNDVPDLLKIRIGYRLKLGSLESSRTKHIVELDIKRSI